MFTFAPVMLLSTAVLGLSPDRPPEEPPVGGEVAVVESAPTTLGSIATALLQGLVASDDAGAPVEQPAAARVVEGKPLTVALIDTTEENADGAAPKAIRISVVGENIAVATADAAAGAPAKKVPFIGVVTAPLSPAVRAQTTLTEDLGLSVESIAPDSPAAKAGLEPFDILAKYDDQLLCVPAQLSALVKRTGCGNKTTLTVIRRGKEMPLEVTVGERDAESTLLPLVGQGGEVRVVAGQPLDPLAVQALPEAVRQALKARAEQGGAQYGFTFPTTPNPPATPDVVPPGVVVPSPGAAAGVGAFLPGGGTQRNLRWVLVNPTTTSQSQSTSVFANDQGQVIHREVNGVRTITILGPDGKQQYTGPWGAPGDKEKVPEELRGRIEQALASAGPGSQPGPDAAQE